MTARRKAGLARIWPLLLIGVTPLLIAAILVMTSTGHPAPGHGATSAETMALLPGATVEEGTRRGEGLIVTSLRSGGAASAAGIAVGDRVVAIDGHPARTLDKARGYIGTRGRRKIVVNLVHDHGVHYVTLIRDGDASHGAKAPARRRR